MLTWVPCSNASVKVSRPLSSYLTPRTTKVTRSTKMKNRREKATIRWALTIHLSRLARARSLKQTTVLSIDVPTRKFSLAKTCDWCLRKLSKNRSSAPHSRCLCKTSEERGIIESKNWLLRGRLLEKTRANSTIIKSCRGRRHQRCLRRVKGYKQLVTS